MPAKHSSVFIPRALKLWIGPQNHTNYSDRNTEAPGGLDRTKRRILVYPVWTSEVVVVSQQFTCAGPPDHLHENARTYTLIISRQDLRNIATTNFGILDLGHFRRVIAIHGLRDTFFAVMMPVSVVIQAWKTLRDDSATPSLSDLFRHCARKAPRGRAPSRG